MLLKMDAAILCSCEEELCRLERRLAAAAQEMQRIGEELRREGSAGAGAGSRVVSAAAGLHGVCMKLQRMTAVLNGAREEYGRVEQRNLSSLQDFGPGLIAAGKDCGEAVPGRIAAPMSEDYLQVLDTRYENAVPEARALYDKYRDEIDIADCSLKDTAYYNGVCNHVKYSWENDLVSADGPGSVYYHEVGHLIDDRSRLFGYSSSRGEFGRLLRSDFDAYVSRVTEEYGFSGRDEAYAYISGALMVDRDRKAAVSDLIGGLTGNECIGAWGHWDDRYWNNYKALEKEAFAEFFEASMGADAMKVQYIREVFPRAYEEFLKTAGELSQ